MGKRFKFRVRCTPSRQFWLSFFVLLIHSSLHFSANAQEKKSLPSTLPTPEKGIITIPTADIITLGTSKENVDLLLGPPTSGQVINCLGRATYSYADGTKITLVYGGVVSATPGGLVKKTPEQGYVIERDGRRVVLDPLVLLGVGISGPLGDVKRQVEERFDFGPPGAPCQCGLYTPPPYRSPPPEFIPLKHIRLY